MKTTGILGVALLFGISAQAVVIDATVLDGSVLEAATWGGNAITNGNDYQTSINVKAYDGTFAGDKLIINSGGQLRTGAAGPELFVNDLEINGTGDIRAINNNTFYIDGQGTGTFTINGGEINGGGISNGDNFNRQVRFRNMALAGSGTLIIDSIGTYIDSAVAFESTVNKSGFSGLFTLTPRGHLIIGGDISETDASFGIVMEGSGTGIHGIFENGTDIHVTSLKLGTDELGPGTYKLGDLSLTADQEAFLLPGSTGSITVVDDEGGGETPIPATFIGISASETPGVLQIEIAAPTPDLTYVYSRTNLTTEAWANAPHSDNAGGPFVVSNLTYSVAGAGSNVTIYVESDENADFFGTGPVSE